MTFSILYKKFIFATLLITAWKVLKYGVFSGPYFPVFGLNSEKYGTEKTPYLDSLHGVLSYNLLVSSLLYFQSIL